MIIMISVKYSNIHGFLHAMFHEQRLAIYCGEEKKDGHWTYLPELKTTQNVTQVNMSTMKLTPK